MEPIKINDRIHVYVNESGVILNIQGLQSNLSTSEALQLAQAITDRFGNEWLPIPDDLRWGHYWTIQPNKEVIYSKWSQLTSAWTDFTGCELSPTHYQPVKQPNP